MAIINFRNQYSQYNRYFTQIKDTIKTKPFVRESLQFLLSLFTISFLIVFALRPTINTIAELLAKTTAQRDVSTKLDTKIQALVQAKQVWDQEQQRLSLVNQALSDKPQPDVFLQQVEGLSAIHNVAINGFSVENVVLAGKDLRADQKLATDAKTDIKGTKSAKYSFTIFGKYTDIKTFLKELEELRLKIRIETYSLGVNTTTVEQSILLKVTGTVPYYDVAQ